MIVNNIPKNVYIMLIWIVRNENVWFVGGWIGINECEFN